MNILKLWMIAGIGLLAACSEENKGEDTEFEFLKSEPQAVRDTIFIDRSVTRITIDLQTGAGYKSSHPEWLKKGETPANSSVIAIPYLVDKYTGGEFRDGTITLSTPDGKQRFSLVVRQKGAGEEPVPDERLLFMDDFEGTTLDFNKWRYESKAGSAWNYYVADDDERVQVKDGNLYVRATWDAQTKTPRTGAVSTQGLFSFDYGEIQVRAKFVRAGQGGWPAIWMMPQTPLLQGWPDCGEIDIMERLNQETKIYTTIHLNETFRPDPYFKTPGVNPAEYNVYGMKKYPGKMEFYLNGVRTFTVEKTAGQASLQAWPFDTDFYLIINQACADQGASGMSFWPGLVGDPSELPFEMAVDWVKVYKLE